MSIGFHVYIDESGDEGFKFSDDGIGSSTWFVLSAVVTRKETDMATVRLVDRIREQLKKDPRTALHFRNLRHENRLPYVDAISQSQLRTISVLVHKPSIREPEKFSSEPHLLYRYATRYLLERVSWFCRDHRKDESHIAKIIFSNRSCMSYDDIRGYMERLRSRTNEFGVRIEWSAIDPRKIESRTHDSMMGLQIADAVASSHFMACEMRRGYNEPRYALMLRRVLYRHENNWRGYGLKFWPREASGCTGDHFEWLNSL